MTIAIFGTAFLVSLSYIALKAYQQLNVMHGEYKLMLPISFLMALCEVTVVAFVVKTSLWILIPIGLGGGLGCMASTYLHSKRKGR